MEINRFFRRRHRQAKEFLESGARTARGITRQNFFVDDLGTLIFLGSLIFFTLYWRIGIFVTDNWTIANTLVAVSDGHLELVRVVYGPNAYAPGLNEIGGKFYGRNYGQVFLALPFYYVLEVLSYVAELSIALAGAWSLLLLAFIRRLGSVLQKPRRFTLFGNGLAILVFAVNAIWAIPIEPRLHYLAALQLSTIFAAAVLTVIIYRLLALIHNRRTGVFVGGITMLASPVAFWASIPKRHVLVSLLALLVLYAFYRSRSAESGAKALRNRCLAYGSVGIWAWVHAPEALAMLAVLIPFDLATARSNAPRRLAIVATTFVVSLIPFFLTNWLIAGNPLKPPRFLSRTPADVPIADPSAGGSDPAGSAVEPFLEQALAQLTSVLRPMTTLLDLLTSGLGVMYAEPSRVFHTFIRSAPRATRATATDLTVLETTPILGVLIAVPVIAWLQTRKKSISGSNPWGSPVRQTDAFGLVFIVAFTLLYMSRLPLHAMWTVRYLLPIVPFGLYFVGRLEPVRRTLSGAGPTLAFTYSALVLIGGQLLVVLLIELDPTQGEVIQFHGLLGLIAATIAAFWAVGATLGVIEDRRIGAVAMGTPLAVGTLYVLLTGLEYFVSGQFALGISQLLSDAIPLF